VNAEVANLPGGFSPLRPARKWRAHLIAAAAYWLAVVAAGTGMFLVVHAVGVPTVPSTAADGGTTSGAGKGSSGRSRVRTGLLIGGTGTGLAVLEVIGAMFEKETGIAVRVAPSIGTSGGLAALADGVLDLAWTSRSLEAAELESFESVELAMARVILAGGRLADTTPLTPREVVALYGGERYAWPDGTPVVVLLREPGDSGTRIFGKVVEGFSAAHDQAVKSRFWRTELSDQAMQRALLDCPGSVGLFDWGTIVGLELPLRQIPVLSRPGGVPLIAVRPLSLVARRGGPDPDVRRFLDFCSGSKVQGLLAAWGYVVHPPEGSR